MSRYQRYMDNHDFYETEAREARDPLKEKIFRILATFWKKKALSLKIEEALR